MNEAEWYHSVDCHPRPFDLKVFRIHKQEDSADEPGTPVLP